MILGKLPYVSEAQLLLCYVMEVRVEQFPPGALVRIKRGHRCQATGTVSSSERGHHSVETRKGQDGGAPLECTPPCHTQSKYEALMNRLG